MAPRLKLFRTPIGFHDAYVAAPSQKAALQAWGADADLFARGIAESIDDPKLLAEAAQKPGTVIKRARGTAAEHLASAAKPMKATPRKAEGRVIPAKPRPRPSRKALDLAEQKLHEHVRSVEARIGELEKERARIGMQIAKVRKEGEGQAGKFQAAVDKARAKYEDALDQWRGQD
ncbi:hypothetical protein ACFOKF_24060 [Sphingobium rhizovicinum]|uniref:Cell envelope biogenesis protein TolA n=1 Tax=Sphingobium rhizovicinum TaxID=432308 RepID=A0ABV7NLJ0_9SPHN|nr:MULTISPECIES: hypothetical protein [Sphingobium]EZP70700.1 hypothetical protein BV96_02997 [Sphingomonas paucimobilis]PHP17668.1 hypothetical protein CG471_21580 [Sphingobium sp. IP1]WRD77096.1 hypothetical protein QQ987_02875 [Sphingobium baderi]